MHCPSCGGDGPVPSDESLQVCFVCHVRWFRLRLTGDDAADWARVRTRVDELGGGKGASGGPGWAAVWQPLLVDCPDGRGGKRTEPMESAFVYLVPGA